MKRPFPQNFFSFTSSFRSASRTRHFLFSANMGGGTSVPSKSPASIRDPTSVTIFHQAARAGNVELMTKMLTSDPSLLLATNSANATALDFAISGGKSSSTAFLLKNLLQSPSSDLSSILFSRRNQSVHGTIAHIATDLRHAGVLREILLVGAFGNGVKPGILPAAKKKGVVHLAAVLSQASDWEKLCPKNGNNSNNGNDVRRRRGDGMESEGGESSSSSTRSATMITYSMMRREFDDEEGGGLSTPVIMASTYCPGRTPRRKSIDESNNNTGNNSAVASPRNRLLDDGSGGGGGGGDSAESTPRSRGGGFFSKFMRGGTPRDGGGELTPRSGGVTPRAMSSMPFRGPGTTPRDNNNDASNNNNSSFDPTLFEILLCAKNNSSMSILHIASQHGCVECMREIVGAAESVIHPLHLLELVINDYDNRGDTPIHFAIRSGNVFAVQFLLTHAVALVDGVIVDEEEEERVAAAIEEDRRRRSSNSNSSVGSAVSESAMASAAATAFGGERRNSLDLDMGENGESGAVAAVTLVSPFNNGNVSAEQNPHSQPSSRPPTLTVSSAAGPPPHSSSSPSPSSSFSPSPSSGVRDIRSELIHAIRSNTAHPRECAEDDEYIMYCTSAGTRSDNPLPADLALEDCEIDILADGTRVAWRRMLSGRSKKPRNVEKARTARRKQIELMLSSRNRMGQCPMMISVMNSTPEIFKLLLRFAGEVGIPEDRVREYLTIPDRNGLSAIHLAASSPAFVMTLKELITSKIVTVDRRDSSGKTALHYAVLSGNNNNNGNNRNNNDNNNFNKGGGAAQVVACLLSCEDVDVNAAVMKREICFVDAFRRG